MSGDNNFSSPGLLLRKSICALAVGEAAFAMLEGFRYLQPDSPTGFLTCCVNRGKPSSVNLEESLCLPSQLLSFQCVLLLLPTCGVGESTVNAIQLLIELGVEESSIFVVTLLASAPAIGLICSEFSDIRIVCGGIDPELRPDGSILPGFGDFIERYMNTLPIMTSSRQDKCDESKQQKGGGGF